MIKEIFYELIEEAKDGKVIIDSEEWPIGFNTKINNREYNNKKNMSCLLIDNEEEFIKILEEYIYLELELKRKIPNFIKDKEKNNIKWIMAYLFVNATTEDFKRPIEYIKKRIDFIKDTTFNYLDEGLIINIGDNYLNSELEIKRNIHSVAMETFYKIDMSLINYINDKKVRYELATVSYGIREENNEKVCYIYSLMKPKKGNNTQEDINYNKKMARMMYKLNDGISNYEATEYFEYKEDNTKYYPEGNITDVTPSFILSLEIFISLLQREGIKKIKGISYLPLRYLSRDLIAGDTKNEDKKYQLKLRNDMIQDNITNKFIRTFRRLNFYNRDINITSYPYEISEYLEVDVKDKEYMISNQILEDISNYVYNMKKEKKLK